MVEDLILNSIIETLKEDDELIAMLDTFSDKNRKKIPMLIKNIQLPIQWDANSNSINIYVVANNTRVDYTNIYCSISCRAKDYNKSRIMANKVVDILNRNIITSNIFIVANISGTIAPSKVGLGSYNTPVELLIRSR